MKPNEEPSAKDIPGIAPTTIASGGVRSSLPFVMFAPKYLSTTSIPRKWTSSKRPLDVLEAAKLSITVLISSSSRLTRNMGFSPSVLNA